MHNHTVLAEFVRAAAEPVGKMFGVEIDAFMETQKQRTNFLNVPVLVRVCGDFLIETGLEVEGLFRVPGDFHAIDSLIKTFEKGEMPSFDDAQPEDVSGAYKKYLRDLPSPLLKENIEKDGVKFSTILDLPENEQVKAAKSLIAELPIYHRALCNEIFYLLYLVSLGAEKNLMHAANLATIFGGMVDIVSNTMSITAKTDLASLLITNYPSIFEGTDLAIRNIEKQKALDESSVWTLYSEQKARDAERLVKVFRHDGSYLCILISKNVTASYVQKQLSQHVLESEGVDCSQYVLYQFSDRHFEKLSPGELISKISTYANILWTDQLDSSPLLLSKACSVRRPRPKRESASPEAVSPSHSKRKVKSRSISGKLKSGLLNISSKDTDSESVSRSGTVEEKSQSEASKRGTDETEGSTVSFSTHETESLQDSSKPDTGSPPSTSPRAVLPNSARAKRIIPDKELSPRKESPRAENIEVETENCDFRFRMADEILDEFAVVQSELQAMVAKINIYQMQIRDEKTATQFASLKDCLDLVIREVKLDVTEQKTKRFVGGGRSAGAWSAFRIETKESVTAIQNTISTIINSAMQCADLITQVEMSMKGLVAWKILHSGLMSYEKGIEITPEVRNSLWVRVVEAKQIVSKEEDGHLFCSLLLDGNQLATTRAFKMSKAIVPVSEAFTLELQTNTENFLLVVQNKESKIGEIGISVRELPLNELQPDRWHMLLPVGSSSLHKGVLNISTTYSQSRFNASVSHIDIDVISCCDVAAHKCIVTVTQINGQPDIIFKTKKASTKGLESTWNQSFSCNLGSDNNQVEFVFTVLNKSKKLVGEARIPLIAIQHQEKVPRLFQPSKSAEQIPGVDVDAFVSPRSGGRRGLPSEWMSGGPEVSPPVTPVASANQNHLKMKRMGAIEPKDKKTDSPLIMKDHSCKLYPHPSKPLGSIKLSTHLKQLVILPPHAYEDLITILVQHPIDSLFLAVQMQPKSPVLLASVVQVFTKHNIIKDCLKRLIEREAPIGDNILSPDNYTGAVLAQYIKLQCKDTVQILAEPVHNLLKAWYSFSEPSDGTPFTSLQKPLETHLEEFWNALVSNTLRFTLPSKRLFFALKKSFPQKYQQIISTLLLKRFFCAVMKSPGEYGLEAPPDDLRLRNLNVLSVIFEYLSGEEKIPDTFYLSLANAWISNTIPRMKSLIDQLCIIPRKVKLERIGLSAYEESMATITEALTSNLQYLQESTVELAHSLIPILESLNGLIAPKKHSK